MRFLNGVIPIGLALCASAQAQPLAVTFRSMVNLPGATTSDQQGAAFTIAGMSGIARRAGDEYLAVMDNSNKLVRLSITLNSNGSIAGLSVLGGVSLAQSRDYEGVVLVPGALPTVMVSEEGTPAVHEFQIADGAFTRTLTTPAVFAMRRDNFGFEALARHAISGRVLTANEEALTVDGALSSTAAGTTVRLLRYAGVPLTPDAQFAYLTQPLHGSTISGARSGLSDLVWLPSGRVISLERSFAFSLAGLFQTRIYELDFAGATEVGGLAGLTGQSFTPVAKRLLHQGSLNNLEGLCLGPRLPGGGYALVGVIDDGDPVSVNAAVTFELTGGVACIADFNDDGTISVQDIFDFFAAYFASQPSADVNGTGGVGVQDIFDFLAAYFAGCA